MPTRSHATSIAENESSKPRITELAKKAGVSPSTISKVINGRTGVSDEIRKKVEEVLLKSGREYSLVSTKVSPTIELLVDYVANNGTIEMITYASRWAQREGLALTVAQTDNGKKRDECLRGIVDRNPLGVISQMSDLTQKDKEFLRMRNIPLIIIDPVSLSNGEDHTISIDNWTGAYELTKHLINLGHKRIGVITGPLNVQSGVARFAGYNAAMEQSGLTIDKDLVKEGDYLPERGYEMACKILDLPEEKRPTAIFACNDITAVNVYRAARERGMKLGSELSVAGFDDVYPAQYLMPSLTTVNQPFDSIAKNAIRMILEIREGKEIENQLVLPAHIVIRESTQTVVD